METKPRKPYRTRPRKPHIGTNARRKVDTQEIIDQVTAVVTAPSKAGRPKVKIDWAAFIGCCRIQCTVEEICAVLNVDDKTLYKHVREEYQAEFSEVYKKYSADGRQSLRRKQLAVAEEGNVAMLIWLGKQYMQQRDKHETPPEQNSALNQLVKAISKIRTDEPTTDTSTDKPE